MRKTVMMLRLEPVIVAEMRVLLLAHIEHNSFDMLSALDYSNAKLHGENTSRH